MSRDGKKGPDKHTDKMGYMSVKVGDSAELFSQHMNEYGAHYGTAAQNIGNFFTTASDEDGVAFQVMMAAQRFAESAQYAAPFVALGSLLSGIGCCAQVLTHSQQAQTLDRMIRVQEGQLALRRSEHLYNLSKKEHIASVVETACFYGGGARANFVIIVFADSYLSTQTRLFLSRRDNSKVSDLKVQVCDTLQEAFDEISRRKDDKNSRSMIYFHSLKQIENLEDLQICACTNFILRSDTGQGGLERRLVLRGELNITRSSGTIQYVGIDGVCSTDEYSNVEFVQCAAVQRDSKISTKKRQQTSRLRLSRMVGASVLVIVSSLLLRSGGMARNKVKV